MSIRNDILDSLCTNLEGIKQDNGYNTTVRKVERYPIPMDNPSELMPHIFVSEGQEEKINEDETNIGFRLSVALNLFMKGQSVSGLCSDIVGFIDDVKKMIYGPISLGDYCLAVNWIDSDQDVSEIQAMARAGIAIEIIYYAPKASF